MPLVDSLLGAIVRLDGSALVMHVGEKPYVVTGSAPLDAFRGPLSWGQVELATKRLTLEAVAGMLRQLLPPDEQQALSNFGAIEHPLAPNPKVPGRFTVIAARGGDDIWLEIRYHRPPEPRTGAEQAALATPAAQAAAELAPAPAPPQETGPTAADLSRAEPLPTGPEPDTVAVEMASDAGADRVTLPSESEAAAPIEPVADAMAVEQAAHQAVAIEPVMAEVEPIELVATELTVAPTVSSEAPAVERPPAEPVWTEPEVMTPAPVAVEPGIEQMAVEPLATEPVWIEPEVIAPVPVAIEPPIEQAAVEVAAEPVTAGPVAEAVIVVPAAEEGVAERAAEEAVDVELAMAEEAAAPVVFERPAEAEPVTIEAPAEAEPVASVAAAVEPLPTEPVWIEPEVIAPVPVAIEPAVEDVTVEIAAEAFAAEPGLEEAVRIEPVAIEPAVHRTSLDRLLRLAAARGASALYIVAQSPPAIRVDGEITVLESEGPLAPADIAAMLMQPLPVEAREAPPQGADAEWIADVPGVGRVRCLSFRDHRGLGGIFRMLPARALSVEQLGLSRVIQALSAESEGLVLVTGPRASGKQTLISAFVDLVNRTRADHVITLESQILFVHESRRSFVSQRELRGTSQELAAAARAALRENPDVLVIADLRSPELISVALEAAELGMLVFAALPASGVRAAIERLVDQFAPEQRAQVQTTLAGALRGVVAQVLVRKIGGGRLAAREVLLNTRALAAVIAEGRTSELSPAIEEGRRIGMVPLNDALIEAVRSGAVDPQEAFRRTYDQDGLLARLRADGIDTSFLERFA